MKRNSASTVLSTSVQTARCLPISVLMRVNESLYKFFNSGYLFFIRLIFSLYLLTEELYNVFFQMRLDHPEIFWVSSYKYRYYKDSPNLIFIPEYLFDKKKICEHQKAMTARVEKLIRPAQKLSEWEKEKYVHDFICENIRYDKLKKSYSHEIIGPLGQGVGVCEGIAKAVKVLLDALSPDLTDFHSFIIIFGKCLVLVVVFRNHTLVVTQVKSDTVFKRFVSQMSSIEDMFSLNYSIYKNHCLQTCHHIYNAKEVMPLPCQE